MNETFLLLPIVLPLLWSACSLLLPRKLAAVRDTISAVVAVATLAVAIFIFADRAEEIRLSWSWAGFGIDFDLRAYQFAKFILLAATAFEALIALYSVSFMKGREHVGQYFAYFLFLAAAANGAILANNFVVLLFFLGAVLPSLYGMIVIGSPEAYVTARKALIMSAAVDFLMLLGVIFLWSRTGTLTMSEVQVPATGFLAVAFVLMALAAMFKAGAMPMHTWIPDASVAAPLPFVSLLPGALEKLIGIYLLTRICLDFFIIPFKGGLSIMLMSIGAVTIVCAVLMALIQKNYKKLLAFHAVSQVGYMILGIGTGVPIGIAGGIFHMLNNAMYKSLLFLTAGSVEKQTGSVEINKLGGLGKLMPVTAGCFAIAAVSISGIPPFNGFVSKEMVFHGTYETGYWVFLLAAWVGALFTFASFLKLGHSVYLGKVSKDMPEKKVKESNILMLIPMGILAFGCILFGVYNRLPLQHLVEPILENSYVLEHSHELEFWRHSFGLNWIAGVSMLVLVAAYLLHRYGVKKAGGKAYMASEPVHSLPGLHQLYDLAEKRVFDIYEWGFRKGVDMIAKVVARGDKLIDDFYEVLVTRGAQISGNGLGWLHNGVLSNYALWVVCGMGLVMFMIFR